MAQIKKWLIICIVMICFLSCSIHKSKSHVSKTDSIVVLFKKAGLNTPCQYHAALFLKGSQIEKQTQ